MLFDELLPQQPDKGPPLPSGLGIKWPWARGGSSSNPGNPVLVDYEVADSKIEELRKAKKSEWLAKGYRPGLVDMALEWADNWTEGMLRSPLYAFLTKEQKKIILPEFYKYALGKAERWIDAFSFS